MRQLHYVNASVIVADIVCKSLLRYARALATSNTSDVVSIPVRLDTGAKANAFFVIGPASQLFSTPIVEPTESEPGLGEASMAEERTARWLERQTFKLQPSRPEWPSEMTDLPGLDLEY